MFEINIDKIQIDEPTLVNKSRIDVVYSCYLRSAVLAKSQALTLKQIYRGHENFSRISGVV